MKKALYFVVLILLISACKEATGLEAEVIAIHDEVMPKMGDMHLARKNLRKIAKEVESDSIKTNIFKMIKDLEQADEGMMTWMHEWKVPANEPEKTTYLEKEKVKITKVKEDMLSSLETANNFIAKSNLK